MLPEDISAYKEQWAPGHRVTVQSKFDVTGKDWCRKHLGRHQWSMDKFTNPDEHTFRFEHEAHALKFEEEFVNAGNLSHSS